MMEMSSVLHVSSILAVISAIIPAGLFAINIWLFRRPGREWNRRALPSLSVLIPARNEEQSIGPAVASVLASRGVELELVVLDDGSTDRTSEIVLKAAGEDHRVRLVSAPPLPAGWNGKQHACWVLASEAENQVFCFLDADVRVGPEALFRMLSELNYEEKTAPEIALVSGFPHQETTTFLEWLLLPLIHFVLLGFLPLPAERRSANASFAAGCGQFLMVRREPYFLSGGHEAIQSTMHDGLLLPRSFRKLGFRTRVFDLSGDADCRMYRSGSEVWSGLSKNATEGMATLFRLPIFTVLLLFGQVLPLPLLVLAALHKPFTLECRASISMCLLALLIGYGMRFVCAWRYRQSWRGALLHPFGILLMLVLQWNAVRRKISGVPATWKQRDYRAG